MYLKAALPWLLALVGLGLGVLIVGGTSGWLFVFAGLPLLVGMWLVLA